MNEILIPQKYTKIGLVTSLFILRSSIYFYIYNEKIVSLIVLLCYIFTNLHWYKIKRNGIIRNLDILFAVVYCFFGCYRGYFYDCRNKFFFNTYCNIFAFIINEILNTFTLYKNNFEQQNEIFKKSVYLRSVLIHTFFLHILQSENSRLVPIQCNLIDN